jgi:hypothetical protein
LSDLVEVAFLQWLLDRANPHFLQRRQRPARLTQAPSSVCVHAEGNLLAQFLSHRGHTFQVLVKPRSHFDLELAESGLPRLTGNRRRVQWSNSRN